MKDYYGNLNIDFGYIFRILRSAVIEHWVKVLMFTLLAAVVTYLLSLRLEPTYRAVATMNVEQRDTAVFDVRELMMNRRDPAYQATQVGVIQSRKLIERVVKQHDLQDRQSFVGSDQSVISGILSFAVGSRAPVQLTERERVQIATQVLQDSLSVVPRSRSYLIDIVVERPEPEEAAIVANSLAQAYIEQIRQQEKEDTQRSQDWLFDRVQTVREELQAAETALQVYKEQENILGDSARSQNFIAEEVGTLSEKFLKAQEERRSLETLYNQIVDIERANGDVQGVADLQADPVIRSFKNELLQLEKEYSELSSRYGPEHRRMIELKSKIVTTTGLLDQQIQRAVAGIKSRYDLARRNESFHEANLEQSTDKVQDLSRKQFTLIDLEQSVATHRDIYEAFLRRCSSKVVMSGFSKVKMSSFVGVDLDGGVSQFEP